jgi:hypothetical protein
MCILPSLGLLVGVFLLVPKGAVVAVVLWGVVKVNPLLGVTLFGAWAENGGAKVGHGSGGIVLLRAA